MTKSEIATEIAPRCPWCGDNGDIVLRNCHDYLCGLPGDWSFRECQGCGSLWLDPRPAESEIPRLYPQNYRLTKDSSETPPLHGLKAAVLKRRFGYDLDSKDSSILGPLVSLSENVRRKVGHTVRHLSKRINGRLLDVGCGNGSFLARMNELGWVVEGLEPDPEAAALARDRGFVVHSETVARAELPRDHYDAITLTHVAEHLSAPKDDFARLTAALRPGGVLVSISPNPRSLLRYYFGNSWYELDPPRHLTLPSEKAYRQVLTQCHCQVQTWTSQRLAYWVTKESSSIKHHQCVGGKTSPAATQIANLLLTLLTPFSPGCGEEIICYAERA